ncbi:hypothetical protein sos41_28380 [Alphaproteobacteria bacterium SO-S41]|nr:hypothetical protein sos41_28380 [Alphaproteobacteria bacterium SO-S41]
MLLPLSALVLTTLFTGAAPYISLVEHPVRLSLSDPAMLAQWQPSYDRALPIQGALALLAALAGAAAWYQTGAWPYLAAGTVMLVNWPFTLLAIMPVNKRLHAIAPQDAGPASRALLVDWGRLHGVRSVLGSVATILLVWVLAV